MSYVPWVHLGVANGRLHVQFFLRNRLQAFGRNVAGLGQLGGFCLHFGHRHAGFGKGVFDVERGSAPGPCGRGVNDQFNPVVVNFHGG